MTKYHCPICKKRTCDSTKHLSLSKLSDSDENKADIIIKCQRCKNTIAVNLTSDILIAEQTVHLGNTTM